LVEWNPKLDETPVALGVELEEFVEICDEFEEDQLEVFGPQIELELGTGSLFHDLGEPSIEIVEGVHEVVEIRDTSEERKCDIEMTTGDTPVHRVEVGDSLCKDYPGDVFEKVGEINLEETPQTPSEPVLFVPSDGTLTSAEPRRKRVKTLAGRMDLSWVRRLMA